MSAPIQILFAEDREDDVFLLLRQLERGGYEVTWERVQSAETFRDALERREWDVILSDFSMPSFSAPDALSILTESGRDIPFIIVSGTIGEDVAVEALKAGAQDFLLKGKLARLVPAIARELREAGVRRDRKQAERHRKQAEETLRKSQERYRRLVENTPAIVYSIDGEGRLLSLNPRFETITAWPASEWIEKPYAGLLHPDNLASFLDSFRRVLNGETIEFEDVQFRARSGEYLTVEGVLTPELCDGAVAGVSGIARDVTDRKRAERILRESEGRLKQILETVPYGILVIDCDGRQSYANSASQAILGLPIDLGKPASELFDMFDAFEPGTDSAYPVDRVPIVRALAGESTLIEEMEVRRKGETKRMRLEVSASPVFDESGHVAYAIAAFADLTERRLLEEQLRRSQKLEALGQLSGAIAHDFNNVLMAITSFATLLQRQIGDDSRLRRPVEEIRKAAERGTWLSRQLLAFGRKQVLSPKTVSLNSVVDGMRELLRRLIPGNIDILMNLAPDVGQVKADPGQIEQIIMNLALNARDAMPQGGKLTIETANLDFDQVLARRHLGVEAGSYVMLSVSDTGCGMEAETKARMFEPFFTTKREGKGTGLGLSTVHGIVKESGGSIWVDSEPDLGSTFKIYLARVDRLQEVLAGDGNE